VGLAAEGVEDEDIETLEQGEAFVGDVGHVGEVGGGAEAVAGDGVAAVRDGHTEEGGAEEGDGDAGGGGEAVEFYSGAGGVAIDFAEGVLEDALDDVGGGVVGVEGKAAGGFEAEGTEVVHAEDVVGVAVGVEDGVDGVEVLAHGLDVEVLAGVDEDVVAWFCGAEGSVGDDDGGAGAAVGRAGFVGRGADGAGAAEGGNRHGGSTAEKGEGSLHAVLADDAGAAGDGGAGRAGLAGGGLAGEGLGYLEEAHVELEEGGVEEGGLGDGEIAPGLVGEDGEHVDGLAGSHDVDLRLLAGGGGAAELHHGLHVEGVDDALEVELGGMVHAGVGGADGGVKAVDGGVEGALGLLGLLGGGGRGELVFAFGEVGVGGGLGGVVRGGRVRGDGLGSGAVDEVRGVGVFGTLQSFGTRRFGLGGGCVGADVAFGGELAAVVYYEFFDVGHEGSRLSVLG
jgi:hypothetical protein